MKDGSGVWMAMDEDWACNGQAATKKIGEACLLGNCFGWNSRAPGFRRPLHFGACSAFSCAEACSISQGWVDSVGGISRC